MIRHNGKCVICNEDFVEEKEKYNGYWRITCSKECYSILRRRRVFLECKKCNRKFEVIKYRAKKAKFCSDECKRAYHKGENHPSWKGGISPYFNFDISWMNIRKKALKRDNNKCKICSSEERLEVHHIIPFRLIGNHKLENLVTLCSNCHHKFEIDTQGLIKGKVTGHHLFSKILLELWMLHLRKNAQYANIKNPLGNFERGSKMIEKLLNPKIKNKKLAYALILSSKQIDGVIDMLAESKKDTVDELKDKLMDIAVYAILAMIIEKEG